MNNIFVCINIYKDKNNNIAFNVEDIYGNPNGLKYQIASKAWRDEDECKEKVIKALGAVMETGSYREKK